MVERPASPEGLVIYVQRASGYTAGHCRTWAEADDLARRCNENVPGDPAEVKWDHNLGYYLGR